MASLTSRVQTPDRIAARPTTAPARRRLAGRSDEFMPDRRSKGQANQTEARTWHR
jgi:hypothetical protein